ncbi:mannose-specific lectin-like [Scophthalmus maximus]|uniref:Bulb-type lectin domain-containing protein n=1 Tax=Scophthalmus maximus TaxID=52904 RepID=A0A8D3DUP6_SCOMX|nr:mannose-specific lectin-like [Scophthalmus maximus]
MNRNSISTDQELRKGEFLMSVNGEFKAIFQDDGNFVIYKWSPIWDTKTCGKNPFRVLLQPDNNLVMYDKCSKPVWATGTHSNQANQRMRLTLTDGGRLVLDKDGSEIWGAGGCF